MTCDESKPWKNPIFAQLIKTQWWGPKGEGRRLGPDPTTNPYLNAPMSMLALVATAVCGMLCCWESTDNFRRLNVSSLACSLEGRWTSTKTFTGEGEGHCVNITEVNSAFRWNHYMKMLQEFKSQSPTYLQTVQHGIQHVIG